MFGGIHNILATFLDFPFICLHFHLFLLVSTFPLEPLNIVSLNSWSDNSNTFVICDSCFHICPLFKLCFLLSINIIVIFC